MKYFFHPEIEAVGICVNCGKAICSECKKEQKGKFFCLGCVEEIFPGRKRHSGLLTTAGVLSIIAGVFAVIVGIMISFTSLFLPAFSTSAFKIPSEAAEIFQVLSSIYIYAGISFMALGGGAISGGIYAFKKKRREISFAGSICALLSSGILGLYFHRFKERRVYIK